MDDFTLLHISVSKGEHSTPVFRSFMFQPPKKPTQKIVTSTCPICSWFENVEGTRYKLRNTDVTTLDWCLAFILQELTDENIHWLSTKNWERIFSIRAWGVVVFLASRNVLPTSTFEEYVSLKAKRTKTKNDMSELVACFNLESFLKNLPLYLKLFGCERDFRPNESDQKDILVFANKLVKYHNLHVDFESVRKVFPTFGVDLVHAVRAKITAFPFTFVK